MVPRRGHTRRLHGDRERRPGSRRTGPVDAASPGACSATATGVTRMVSAGANTLIADAEDTRARPAGHGQAGPPGVGRVRGVPQAVRRRDAQACRRSRTPTSPPSTTGARRRSASAPRCTSSSSTSPAAACATSSTAAATSTRRRRWSSASRRAGGSTSPTATGLVHTELTPAKLVFGDDRRLRIVDFGLARLLGEHDWREPATRRHPRRPLQLARAGAGAADRRQDRRLLAGADPRRGGHRARCRSPPARRSPRCRPAIGRLMPVSADLGPLASVLERAGRPDPADRSTAAELGRALVRAAEKLPRPTPIPLLVAAPFDDDPSQHAPAQRPDRRDRPTAEPPTGARRAARSATRSCPRRPAAPDGAGSRRLARSLPRPPQGPRRPALAAEFGPADRPAADAAAAGRSTPPPRRHRRAPRRCTTATPTCTIDELAALGRPVACAVTVVAAARPPVPPRSAGAAGGAGGEPEAEPRRRRRWLAVAASPSLVARRPRPAWASSPCALFRTSRRTRCPTRRARRGRGAGPDRRLRLGPRRRARAQRRGARRRRIIRTAPSAGEHLAEGEPFLVVVSEGPELRTLPDLAGLTARRSRDGARRAAAVALPADRAVRRDGAGRLGDLVVGPVRPVARRRRRGAARTPRSPSSCRRAGAADVPALAGLPVDEAAAASSRPSSSARPPSEPCSATTCRRAASSRPAPAAGTEVRTRVDGHARAVEGRRPGDDARPRRAQTSPRRCGGARRRPGSTSASLLGRRPGARSSRRPSPATRPQPGDQFRRGTPVDLIFL